MNSLDRSRCSPDCSHHTIPVSVGTFAKTPVSYALPLIISSDLLVAVDIKHLSFVPLVGSNRTVILLKRNRLVLNMKTVANLCCTSTGTQTTLCRRCCAFGVLSLSLAYSQALATTRRSCLVAVSRSATSAVLFLPAASWAIEELNMAKHESIDPKTKKTPIRRPSADVEYLIPAANIKLRIDQSITTLQDPENEPNDKQWHVIETLRDLWQIENLPRAASSNGSSGTTPTGPSATVVDAYTRNRQSLRWWQQPGAWLVQSGEISAWQRLRRQESSRAQSDPWRASFNYYTDNLNYSGTEYVWNESPALRSKQIRDERLPTVMAVVNADLDLRYLYRNQALTALEETRAELALEDPSVVELNRLLLEAREATDKWFAFIAPEQVELALKRAMLEG